MRFFSPLAHQLSDMPQDCSICLGEHDVVIHESTLRVKSWFRAEVLRKLNIDEEELTAALDYCAS